MVIASFFCWISHYRKDFIIGKEHCYWGAALLLLTPTQWRSIMREAAGGSGVTEFSKPVAQANPDEPFLISSVQKHGATDWRWHSWGSSTPNVLGAMKCVRGKAFACMGLNITNNSDNNKSNRIYYLLDAVLGAKHIILLNPLSYKEIIVFITIL